jgi:hypothetical protein
VAQLNSGELICLFVMGEAFEAPNLTTCVTRPKHQARITHPWP